MFFIKTKMWPLFCFLIWPFFSLFLISSLVSLLDYNWKDLTIVNDEDRKQEKQERVLFRSNSKTFSFKEKSDAHWQEFCIEIQTWLAGTELIALPLEPLRPRPYNMCEWLSWTALTKDRIYKLRMPLKKPVLSQVLRHFYRKNNNVPLMRGNCFRTIYWEDGKRKAKRSTHSEIQTHKLTFTSRVLGRCATIADLSR